MSSLEGRLNDLKETEKRKARKKHVLVQFMLFIMFYCHNRCRCYILVKETRWGARNSKGTGTVGHGT